MEFTILGRTELRIGARTADLGVAKQRALLAILLLNVGKPVQVETLIQQLWGDRASESLRNTLQGLVSRLRGALRREGVEYELPHESGAYRLSVEPQLIDYHRFRRLLAQADSARADGSHQRARGLLSEAIGLWRGTPLADVRTEWATQRRRQMVIGELLRAHQALVSIHLELGDHSEALNRLGLVIDDHPTDEILAGQWMLALDGLGRLADAANFFVQFRRLILSELGVEPGPEIQAIYARILSRRRPTPSSSSAHSSPDRTTLPVSHMPRGATNFTGRDDIVTALDCLLPGEVQHSAPAAALHGMAGVGKTAVAVFWAMSRRDRFPGGQMFLNLNAYGAGAAVSAADAMAIFLFRLGVPADRIPTTTDQRQVRLNHALRSRLPTLIILDNVLDSDHARPLLLAVSNTACSVLATSRSRLTGLAVLDGVSTVEAHPMSQDDSVLLLSREIGDRQDQRDLSDLRSLAEMSAGLPLALKIIGRHAVTHRRSSTADLARELDGLVSMTDSDDEAATLSGVFRWSYASLSDGAARLFRLLGLHPGHSFDAAAADALYGAGRGATRDQLMELAQGHLLEPTERQHFLFHDLLHKYARDRVAVDEVWSQRQTALVRLADFYLRTATNARDKLAPNEVRVPSIPASAGVEPLVFIGAEDAFQWLDDQRSNLIAVAHAAAANQLHGYAWRIPATTSEGLERSGFKDDFLDVLTMGLRSAEILGDEEAVAGMLLNIGRIHFGQRDYRQAREVFGRAIDMAEAVGKVNLVALGHHNLATTHLELGELSTAIELYERALVLHRQIDSVYYETFTLHRMADAHRRLGQFDRAASYYETVLTIRQDIGHLRGQGDTLTELGLLHYEWQRYDTARDYCRRALEVHELSHDGVKAAEALTVLASVQLATGFIDDATEHAGRAVELGETTQDWLRQARALTVLGQARLAADDPASARTCWVHALGLFKDMVSTEGNQVRAFLNALD